VVSHLADAELVYAIRIRTALAQPGGALPGFDENAWADRFGPHDDDPHVSMARFRAVRENTVTILDSLTDEEWQRVGIHDELGELTVAALVQRLVDHDAAHLDQLRAALA